MNDEFDINEIISNVAQANIDRFAGAIGAKAKKLSNATRAKFRSTYRNYLNRLLTRYSRGKAFLFGSEPVPLYDFFVPLDLSSDQRTLKSANIADIASASSHSVISGTGGCGKTVLMRHLLVGCIQLGSRVPAFIELRNLNDEEQSLRVAILDAFEQHGFDIDESYLEKALASGHFCLLLDGFDELNKSLRKNITKQVGRLATKYPDNWIVLTSRPDSELNALSDFSRFDISPLTQERALDLVKKLPVEKTVKDKFSNDLKQELFERHESFLSNPLLLSIMLLTYQDAAHIPTKLNLFYEQAFEALFQKHDARKGGYTRQRCTTLDMQDFAKAFSAFCLLTYDKRKFRFTGVSAIDSFTEAKSISQLEYQSSDFLNDCIQAVCLLVEDGLEISFAHRSFQEYFTARFISRTQEDTKQKLIERFVPNVSSDSVLALLWEMDQSVVESCYVIPEIIRLKKQIGFRRQVGITHYLKYLNLMFKNIHYPSPHQGGLSFGINNVRLFDLIQFIFLRYPSAFSENSITDDSHANWNTRSVELLKEISKGEDSIKISTLKTTSPLVRHLANGHSIFSKQAVMNTIKLCGFIIKRHAEAKRSLDELFVNAHPDR